MIDEIDTAANNQVFIDFLAQLRACYMTGANALTPGAIQADSMGFYTVRIRKVRTVPKKYRCYLIDGLVDIPGIPGAPDETHWLFYLEGAFPDLCEGDVSAEYVILDERYSKEEICNILKQIGFEIEETLYVRLAVGKILLPPLMWMHLIIAVKK